jgi:hypothetical protein
MINRQKRRELGNGIGMDEQNLHCFEQRRESWIQCLRGSDRHSIMHQVHRLIWDAAAFRVINEARALAAPAEDGGVQLNGLTHALINDCFAESQFSGIRRLVDNHSIDGARGVYSLASLLRDMEKMSALMTREHLLSAERLPYNYEPDKQAFLDELASKHATAKARFERTGTSPLPSVHLPLPWHFSERRHQHIDALCGVAAGKRACTDTIPADLFKRLEKKLARACDPIARRTDKFIAHAATPQSRAVVKADEMRVTLADLWAAHQAICEIGNFLGSYVLGECPLGGLAIPQYDPFTYIERPLVSKANIARLRKAWNDYQQETNGWETWGLVPCHTMILG